MAAAAPLARYSAMWRARFASGSANTELHHHPGHDRSVLESAFAIQSQGRIESWAASGLRTEAEHLSLPRYPDDVVPEG
jgi:hypothetical protein